MSKPLDLVDVLVEMGEMKALLLNAGNALVQISDHLFWLSLRTDVNKLHGDISCVHASVQPLVLTLIEEIRKHVPSTPQGLEADEPAMVSKGGAA